MIPAVADAHVPHFVAVDNVQHFAGGRVAALRHFGADGGGHIQAARFQHPRHQGHPQQRVVGRLPRHVPQMRVRRKVAVIKAVFAQPFAHQQEMVAFFFGHTQPVARKFARQAAETVGRVQSQIDGVELDVRDGVQHCGITLRRGKFARFHLRIRHQRRLRRPAGHQNVFCGGCRLLFIGRAACQPMFVGGISVAAFFVRVLRQKCLVQQGIKRFHKRFA